MLIVEFTHPSREFVPRVRRAGAVPRADGTWDREWNSGRTHERRFILAKGKSRDTATGSDSQGMITFWGEWEPQSICWEIGQQAPRFVHMPYLDPNRPGIHNTDPFVFGRSFWFTNCKQLGRPFLRALPPGSLILFGSEFDRGFALDTVFVVDDHVTPEQYRRNPGLAPMQLRIATLDHQGLAADPGNASLKFYRGARPGNLPFSFVPCRRLDSRVEISGHGRLMLDYDKFELQRPGARTVCTRIIDPTGLSALQVLNYWKRIVAECKRQNFLLGHSIELPPAKRFKLRLRAPAGAC